MIQKTWLWSLNGLDWLHGPSYLKNPISEWPVDRKFSEKKSKLKIPVNEVKKKYRSQVEDFDQTDYEIGKMAVDLLEPGGKDVHRILC